MEFSDRVSRSCFEDVNFTGVLLLMWEGKCLHSTRMNGQKSYPGLVDIVLILLISIEI